MIWYTCQEGWLIYQSKLWGRACLTKRGSCFRYLAQQNVMYIKFNVLKQKLSSLHLLYSKLRRWHSARTNSSTGCSHSLSVPLEASITIITKSAVEAASFARFNPSFSTGSVECLNPAVSHKTIGKPPISNEISKMSRVVPAYGDTIATFFLPKYQNFFLEDFPISYSEINRFYLVC